jgi:hypothetical protein
MPSPDQMFTLDTVQTKVTQPVTQITAQKPIDTSVQRQQLSGGMKAFGTALGSLAETQKKQRIKGDIDLAQEAAIRNEIMPGGLLPIAQRAFENTQDIQTANQAYTDIEVFSDGEEVKAIMNNSLLTPIQKNNQINNAIDNLWQTSAVSIRNPETLIKLKSKVDGLKIKNMKDVYNIDKNHKFGVQLSAINGQIDNGFDQIDIPHNQIFTGKWLQNVTKQTRASLPWVSADDAKLAIFSSLANNENMVTNPDIMLNLMQSDFSPNVSFAALGNSATTEAGIKIKEIYKAYLAKVDKHDSDERKEKRLIQNDANEGAVDEAIKMVKTIKPTDPDYANRWPTIMDMMTNMGAEHEIALKFVSTWEKVEETRKHNEHSSNYRKVEELIFTGKTEDIRDFVNAISEYGINNDGMIKLKALRVGDFRAVAKGMEDFKRKANTITSGLNKAISSKFAPDTAMMNMFSKALENDPDVLIQQEDMIRNLFGKQRMDSEKYIEAIRILASDKEDLHAEMAAEVRAAQTGGEGGKRRDINFDPIIDAWGRKAQAFLQTLKEETKELQESDKEAKIKATAEKEGETVEQHKKNIDKIVQDRNIAKETKNQVELKKKREEFIATVKKLKTEEINKELRNEIIGFNPGARLATSSALAQWLLEKQKNPMSLLPEYKVEELFPVASYLYDKAKEMHDANWKLREDGKVSPEVFEALKKNSSPLWESFEELEGAIESGQDIRPAEIIESETKDKVSSVEPKEPSLIETVAHKAAPLINRAIGLTASTVEARETPKPFEQLPKEVQQLTETSQYVTDSDAAKSIQRNNPFNVEKGEAWQGLVKSDSDRFFATDTPLNGLRAGYINFLAKLKRGLTLSQTIEKLSPASDKNPTSDMIEVVAGMSGIGAGEKLEVSMKNFEAIKQLGLGLLRFEAPGHTYPDSMINEAVKLAIEQKTGATKQSVKDKSKMYPPPKNFKKTEEVEIKKGGKKFGALATPKRAYARAMLGDRGIWKEDLFTDSEHNTLKNIAVNKIKQGNYNLSYKDWNKEAGSKINYKMGMPDKTDTQNLKFTLGKASIVRSGNRIMVVDEWDIDSPTKLNEKPVGERIEQLYKKVKSGKVSAYGFGHILAEAFGPQGGEGASIRATLGSAKSLGLTQAQLAKIPDLKSYEAKNKSRINPDNIGKFA